MIVDSGAREGESAIRVVGSWGIRAWADSYSLAEMAADQNISQGVKSLFSKMSRLREIHGFQKILGMISRANDSYPSCFSQSLPFDTFSFTAAIY